MAPSTVTEPLSLSRAKRTTEVGWAPQRRGRAVGIAVGLGAAAEMTTVRVDGEVALDWARAVELRR